MNKLEWISELREKTGLSKPEAASVVELFVDNMADALERGNRVEIRGLCSFSVKKYKSYTGRNPKSGEIAFDSFVQLRLLRSFSR